MLVTFKTMDHVVFKFEVDPTEKVIALKQRLQKGRGPEYCSDGIKLIYSGKILNDDKIVNDYKIHETGFIMVVLPKPKQKTPSSTSRQDSVLQQNLTPIPLDYQDNDPDEPLEKENLFQSTTSSDTGQLKTQQSFRSAASSESGVRRRNQILRGTSVISPTNPAAQTFPEEGASPFLTRHDLVRSSEELAEPSKQREVSEWLEQVTPQQPPLGDELPDPGVETIIGMGFEREQAETALAVCSYNVALAIEHLIADQSNAQETNSTIPAVVPAASVLPTAASVLPTRSFQLLPRNDEMDEILEFILKDEKFQNLRILCHAHPDTLPSALEAYKSEHSDLEWAFEAYEDQIVELLTKPVDGWDHSPAGHMETDPNFSDYGFNPDESRPTKDKFESDNDSLSEHGDVSGELSRSKLSEQDLDPENLREQGSAVDPEGSCPEVPKLALDERLPPDGEAVEEPDDLPQRIDDKEEEELSKDLIAAILMEDEAEDRRLGEIGEIVERDSSSEGLPETEISRDSDGAASFGAIGQNRTRGKTLEELGYVRVTIEEKQAIDRLRSLGFPEDRCVQIFLACDRNEQLAADILLDKE